MLKNQLLVENRRKILVAMFIASLVFGQELALINTLAMVNQSIFLELLINARKKDYSSSSNGEQGNDAIETDFSAEK